jgi:hypothetical protein
MIAVRVTVNLTEEQLADLASTELRDDPRKRMTETERRLQARRAIARILMRHGGAAFARVLDDNGG